MANATEYIKNLNHESSENFDIKFLADGVLNKDLAVYDKQRVSKHPWKEIYEVIGEDYFKQSYVVFPKYFISKFKKHYNEPQFIYVEF